MMERVAGAPISWGVCEAPQWGHQLPAQVVLGEMARLGLTATELGPTGYLGDDIEAVTETLRTHRIRLVGGFLPVVLHTGPDLDPAMATDATAAIAMLAAGGSDTVVLAADWGGDGYDGKRELTDEEWKHLAANLGRVRRIATDHGLASTLHPHVGTAIESEPAVHRLLESTDIDLCLDTGHLLIGGTDPVELARSVPERIGHVHLKDVRADVAAAVGAGSTGFLDGVESGLFAPLGDGDIDIAAIVGGLEAAGYTGWYVLEQDTSLPGPGGVERASADAERSVAYIRALAGAAA